MQAEQNSVPTQEIETVLDFFHRAKARTDEPFTYQAGLLGNSSLFSVSKLQHYLNNPLLTPDWIQVNVAGQPVSMAESCVWKVVQRRKLMCMDKSALNQAIARGGSVILEGLDLLDLGLNTLCQRIDDSLPCALVNCEAFFSQRGNEAYGGHRDGDDVLVLQFSGEKLWHIHEPQRRRFTGNSPLTEAEMGPIRQRQVMRSGDALFLRAGVPHRCITQGTHSLHLAFDLSDRTPNALQITEQANMLFAQAPAPPNVPPQETVRHYVDLLTSDHFGRVLDEQLRQTKAGTREMRQWLSLGACVTALDRFVSG